MQGMNLSTFTHAAPENIALGRAGKETDVWALGCCLWNLWTRSMPWRGIGRKHICAFVTEDGLMPHRALIHPRVQLALGDVVDETYACFNKATEDDTQEAGKPAELRPSVDHVLGIVVGAMTRMADSEFASQPCPVLDVDKLAFTLGWGQKHPGRGAASAASRTLAAWEVVGGMSLEQLLIKRERAA